MYHYFNAITNSRGDALSGYYVRATNSVTGSAASLYADENGTPIVSVSDLADAALVDGDGNVSFYIDVGTYDLDIYATDGSTFVRRVSDIPMLTDVNVVAPTTVATRTLLAGVSSAIGTVLLTEAGREGMFVWSGSDLSASVTADPGQGIYVAPTSTPTGASGAWVRKYSGSLNAKWFGTTGDGSTDDLTAGNRALSVAGYLGGGIVNFPAGTYIISASLTPASNTKIVLEGGATIKVKAAAAFVDTGMFHLDAKSNVEICGPGTLDGNKASASAARVFGVYVKNACSNVKVHGLLIKDIPSEGAGVNGGDGVYIGGTGPSDVWVHNNRIANCSRNGIAIAAGSRIHICDNTIDTTDNYIGIDVEPNGAATLTDITIRGNTILNTKKSAIGLGLNNITSFSNISVIGNTVKGTVDTTYGHGIEINSTGAMQGVSVIGNSIFDTAANGIYAQNASNEGALISGNWIRSCTGYGIRTNSFDKGAITGNVVDADTVACIQLDATTETVVSGNYLRANGNLLGISADGCSDCVITGNIIRQIGAAASNGIRIFTSGTGMVVTSNRVRGFSNGITVSAGTNAIVQGNNVENNTIAISNAGTTTKIRNNVGWVTENSGTGTINSGATTATITHGLSSTPTAANISILFTEQGTNDYGRWWVDTITSTQFTVRVSADPGASNLDFSWQALIR